MKVFFVFIVRIFIKFLSMFVNFFSENATVSIMKHICKAVETSSSYVTFLVKSKISTNIPLVGDLNKSCNLAIVMQGPICTQNDMTVNSILFYKKVYPHALIIVSTWEDEPADRLERLSNLGVKVVRSKRPLNSGILNVNFQLVNSLAGIKEAKKYGCTYAVKTRTDQRICKSYIFDSMISALNAFPSKCNCQKGRLIVLGMPAGSMFAPYNISDFMYLGYTDDLIKLFSAPLDKRRDDDNDNVRRHIFSATRRQNAEEMFAPEIYILKHYCCDILNCDCKNTVENFWEIVKNNLICFGMKDVDIMWEKYDRLYDLNFFYASYYEKTDSTDRMDTLNFDFFNWFNLYSGNTIFDKKFEKYADTTAVAKKNR